MTSKDILKKRVKERLEVPLKAIEGDENKNIEEVLGNFLVERGYIKGVDERSEDWGFVYYSITRRVAISQKEMPHKKWEECIFKMGKNRETEENLFPSPGEETEKYRFLHEASHAYQEYLCFKESPEDPACWYQKALQGDVNSFYGKLFRYCFEKRAQTEIEEGGKKNYEKGLSVWGNASNYNFEKDDSIPNKDSEIAVRAQEDANELVTMFLWHPDYFNSYIDYLSLNHENDEVREKELTKDDLEKEKLINITKDDALYLRSVVRGYIREMKKSLGIN